MRTVANFFATRCYCETFDERSAAHNLCVKPLRIREDLLPVSQDGRQYNLIGEFLRGMSSNTMDNPSLKIVLVTDGDEDDT